MRKLALVLVAFLLISLCGCFCCPNLNAEPKVERLNNWSCEFDDEANVYSVFFGLLDNNKDEIAADVNVDIRIVNDNHEEVYKRTHTVTKEDFCTQYRFAFNNPHLAEIRIPAGDVEAGTSTSGKVYLKVYDGKDIEFDEVHCTLSWCLPILDVQVVAKDLPKEIKINNYFGELASVYRIEDVTFTFDTKFASTVEITVCGTKTLSTEYSGVEMFRYKIYDSKGYVVETGIISPGDLAQGDKFREESIYIFDAVPGETYTIEFYEKT